MRGMRAESLVESQLLLIGAQATQLGLGLLLTVVLLRGLDDPGFGLFTLTGSLLGIGARVVDAGLTSALVSELSGGDGGRAAFRRVVRARARIAACAAPLLGSFVYFAAAPDERDLARAATAALVGIGIGVLPLRTWSAPFSASRRNRVPAAVGLAAQVAFVGVAIALTRRYGAGAAVGVAGALAIREIASSVGPFALARADHVPPDDPGSARVALPSFWPLAVAALSGALSLHADVIMIEILRDQREVGVYGAGLRFLLPVVASVNLLAAPLLPFLSRRTERGGPSAGTIVRSATTILGAVIPVSLWLLLGEDILTWVAGRAIPDAGAVLRLLAPVPMCVVFGSIASLVLISMRRYRTWCLVTSGGAILNLALNAVWIPTSGALGAARATLLTEAAVAAVGLALTVRSFELKWLHALRLLVLPLVPSALGVLVFAAVRPRGAEAVVLGAGLAAVASVSWLVSPAAAALRRRVEGAAS